MFKTIWISPSPPQAKVQVSEPQEESETPGLFGNLNLPSDRKMPKYMET